LTFSLQTDQNVSASFITFFGEYGGNPGTGADDNFQFLTSWIGRNRRLAKEFEATIDFARAVLHAASIMLLVRRIARASLPTISLQELLGRVGYRKAQN